MEEEKIPSIENLEGLEVRKPGGLKDQKSAFHSTEVPWVEASFPEGLLRTKVDDCSQNSKHSPVLENRNAVSAVR